MALDDKVQMKIVPQVSGPKPGRRGQRKLTKNTLLWCIEYSTGGFFTFSYYRKMDAIKVMNLMKQYGTDTEKYRDFNIVPNVDRTMHVMPNES